MTDNFILKDGYVADGHVIGFCICTLACTAGTWVTFGTSVANYVAVTPTALASDAVGMALRAGAAGDVIPVCFNGVVKTVAGAAIAVGALVGSQFTSTLKVVTHAYASNLIRFNGIGGNYTARIIGTALQEAAVDTDEILVLIGKF